MRVRELWRYPVKSLGGERLDEATVDELGIRGDRAWGLHDPSNATVLTARREPALLFLSARLVDDRPVITDEDGTILASDDELSARLGRPVRLRPASEGPGTFENPMDVDRETDWIQWQSNGGTFHDGRSKLSLVSVGSLGDDDARRFRINVILDGDGEDQLAGELELGSTVVRIRAPIDRCVMVTRAQPGLPGDREVLKRIIRERGNRLGVGAIVTSPGTIRVGDAIAPG